MKRKNQEIAEIGIRQIRSITIEITGVSNPMAWYAKKIGTQFDALTFSRGGDAKVIRGKDDYSFWIESSDYRIVMVNS